MRLLIVEDDRKLADLEARALRAEGYIVDVAGDGEAGRQLIASHSYELLILDLMLPKLSGTELLRSARKTDPSVPVLVVSALDATEDKVQHFEAGADDYLTKPFDFAEFLVRVKALLRRSPIDHTDVLLLSDLEVNRLTHEVHRAGERIELTNKEYALLELLLSSPNRVLTRSMLLNKVWDQSFEGASNIVDVYVRHLRQKVDEPFSVKLIHTVRGVGYCVRSGG
jgi:two-component system copper resistance phosphate regulon response regulator CusR